MILLSRWKSSDERVLIREFLSLKVLCQVLDRNLLPQKCTCSVNKLLSKQFPYAVLKPLKLSQQMNLLIIPTESCSRTKCTTKFLLRERPASPSVRLTSPLLFFFFLSLPLRCFLFFKIFGGLDISEKRFFFIM